MHQGVRSKKLREKLFTKKINIEPQHHRVLLSNIIAVVLFSPLSILANLNYYAGHSARFCRTFPKKLQDRPLIIIFIGKML